MNRDLERLVREFRVAIEKARADKSFAGDLCFDGFPHACCGPTSNILANFLHMNGIDTIYVCGWQGDQSHAWLVLKDEKIRGPQKRYFVAPDGIKDVLNLYSGGLYNEPVDITHYEAGDLENGLIIDITADQFPEMLEYPVYIGFMNSFHRKFEFDQAHDFFGLGDARLERIYNQICSYL